MADDKAQVYVTLFTDSADEQKILLVLPEDWTFDDAVTAKDISGGMVPDEVSVGMMQGDPHAWLAILRVSYRYDGREFPAQRIMGQNLRALTKDLEDAMREAMKAHPTSPNPTGSSDAGPSESSTPAPATPVQE